MTSHVRLLLVIVCAALLASCGGEREELGAERTADEARERAARDWSAPRLIPRAQLFGDPQRARGRLSPDGTQLAWLEPVDGVLNIWTAPVEHPEDVRLLTPVTEIAVNEFDWLRNNTHIAYSLGSGGGALRRVYAVDVITGETRRLAPGGNLTRSWLAATSWDYPDEVIVAANDRNLAFYDLHRVNVVTGESIRIFVNTERFTSFYFDNALQLRMAGRETPEGARELFARGLDGSWVRFGETAAEDAATTSFISYDGTNAAMYALDSRDRNATALIRYDFETLETVELAEVAGVDISDVLLHPTTYEADAVLIDGLSVEWLPLTMRAASAFRVLDQHLEPGYSVISRTVDDRLWIVFEGSATNPGVYHLFNRETGEVNRLIDVRPDLASLRLAPMTPVVIESRDGLDLISYLTLPPGADADGDGRPETRSPLVIIPEIGPQRRTNLGYDSAHQWLADRGYAVLSVNVRGAVGFGKAFVAAGDGEVGGAVQNDLRDAAAWAVEHGVADPDLLAAFGFGFAGHASLVEAAAPDTPFQCVASYNAPADLVRLGLVAPASWGAYTSFLRRRLGDMNDVEVRSRLAERSPSRFAESIHIPTLFAHGGLDAGAQQGLARDAAQRADAAGAPVTYFGLAEDSGTLQAPQDRRAFYAALEEFFADCLGGDFEPIGDDVAAAHIDSIVGADRLPAFAAALAADLLTQTSDDE